MKLYDFDKSPSPLKVRLALSEIGVEYQTHTVNLLEQQQKDSTFLKVNPLGKVPVLEDGSVTLRESNAILTYLGREYGKGLWPITPQAESEALQWLFYESAHMSREFGAVWWADIVSPALRREVHEGPVLEEAAESIREVLGFLESHFKKQPFVLGSEFTLVDCAFGTALNMIRGTRVDKRTVYPNVTDYRERFRKRKSWAEANGEAIHRWKNP